jgi:hypothetical protein
MEPRARRTFGVLDIKKQKNKIFSKVTFEMPKKQRKWVGEKMSGVLQKTPFNPIFLHVADY